MNSLEVDKSTKPYGSMLNLEEDVQLVVPDHVYISYPSDQVLRFKNAIKWVR